MEKKRILIADDHALVRDGLCRLIDNEPGMEVVGAVEDGSSAIHRTQTTSPDLLLVDLDMPDVNGADVIRSVLSIQPDLPILVLTGHTSPSYISSAISAGAKGYIVKTGGSEEILRAISCILQGMSYISPEIAAELMSGYVKGVKYDTEDGPLAQLTPREREIFNFIALGEISNKELSKRLFLSEKTIQHHKTNLFRKLGVHDSQELLTLIRENELG